LNHKKYPERITMDKIIKDAIQQGVKREPFAQLMKLELVELEEGFSAVEMTYEPETMDNIFSRAHGGAIFSLIDEAFETVCQTCGVVTVALNVSVTYVSSPKGRVRLRAEAREISGTKQTASYDIRVSDQDGRLIAICQALAFRTGKPLPFL
jgi:acyl-CoA thioesterase